MSDINQDSKRLPRAESKRRWDTYVANDCNAQQTALALGLSYAPFRIYRNRMMDLFRAEGINPLKVPARWWKKYIAEDPQTVVKPDSGEIVVDRDAVAEHRRQQELRRLKREAKEANERAAKAEDLRTSVFGLVETPPEPISFQPAKSNSKPSPETVLVNLSDWHWGEKVSYQGMDGVNSYSRDIASARSERCFQAILDLMTKHWAGPPPERFIGVLGGDMIAGEIHKELEKTNELMAIPAVRDVATHLHAGFSMLRENLSCPIEIISLAGNHGRNTLKPESKDAAINSYDLIVSDFLEMRLKADYGDSGDITFYAPASPDAVFSVYGWTFLCTHGDNIGTGGGQGFIGPAAPAARGMKKLIADYSARGIHIDYIILDHFHTALALEEGFVNGSLVGHNEFARRFRMKPRPATQLFLSVHPRRGISQYRFINVGAPEEGSLYVRPEPKLIRPKFNINVMAQE